MTVGKVATCPPDKVGINSSPHAGIRVNPRIKKAAAVARSTLSPARLSSTSVPATFTTPWAKVGLTLAVLNLCTTPVAAQNITTYNTTLPFVAKAIESTCDLTGSELAYLYEVMIKAWSNPFSLLAIAVAYVVIKKASPIAKKYVLLAKALIADKIGQVKGMFYSMLFSSIPSSSQITPQVLKEEIAIAQGMVKDKITGKVDEQFEQIEEGLVGKVDEVAEKFEEAQDGLMEFLGKEEDEEEEEVEKIGELDQATQVFNVLFHFLSAFWAFSMYLMNSDTNFMCSPNTRATSAACMMYKPATLSLWMVLMSTSHLAFWRRVRVTKPKEQTNILPGTPELPENTLSALILNTTFFLFGLWFIAAAFWLPLHLAFLPFSLFLMFGVPLLFMKLPVYLVGKASKALGVKEIADTGILELKVMAAATVATLVAAIEYVEMYAELDMDTWSRAVGDMFAELISDFSLTFSFNPSVSISWPSGLNFNQQVPLAVSSALFSVRTLEIIFKCEQGAQPHVKSRIWTAAVFEGILLGPARAIASLHQMYNERVSTEKEGGADINPHVDIYLPESVKELKPEAFKGCKKVKAVYAPGLVTIGDRCFEGCSHLEKIESLAPAVEDIGENAFLGCGKLVPPELAKLAGEEYDQYVVVEFLQASGMLTVPLAWKANERLWSRDGCKAKCGHITTWNVSVVVDMSELFKNATVFNEDLGELEVSGVTKMNSMFEGASLFEGTGIGKWNVSVLTGMKHMFKDALSFRGEGIERWDTENVRQMFGVFQEALQFDVEKVNHWKIAVKSKFDNENLKAAAKEWCEDSGKAEAKYAHISGWDTSEVTSMRYLFSGGYGGSNLTEETAAQFNDDISRWNVDRVGNMSHMFNGAEKFDKDSVKNWDLSGKATMSMFG
ncbi:hypothetical protein TrLO_g2595 [Triparma laevis f. longispina]|uniref:Uncharacterized protein n=2 Tax=Triparma laevis f. longispina TaxID=1714387 RepID=A0A9W7FMQ1_9STRA|nr:hypothetical protein TrLO_g2595 [Triparma laevis f. longispina]